MSLPPPPPPPPARAAPAPAPVHAPPQPSAPGAPTREGSEPLKEVKFTELYISSQGRGMIRAPEGICFLGDGYQPELDRMLEEIKAQEHGEFVFEHDTIRYRAGRIESEGGVWWALRRQSETIPSMDQIGLQPVIRDKLIALGRRPGLILLAGATASGKTTTVCSLLNDYLERYGDVAVTIESPAELPLDGPRGKGWCFQMSIQENEFNASFGKAMRYRPRYILLGEIRYAESARQVLRAAISGHMVLTTIHAGSIEQALLSLIEIANPGDPGQAASLLADGLSAVIWQKLDFHPVRLTAQSLVMPSENSEGMRAKIRLRKFEMLKTDILSQSARSNLNPQ